MNVCVVGTGYVGLVSGACFAEFGVQVVCADNDAAKVASLQEGNVPIYEPGLEGLVERNVRQGRLSFTTDTAEAVRSSLVVSHFSTGAMRGIACRNRAELLSPTRYLTVSASKRRVYSLAWASTVSLARTDSRISCVVMGDEDSE